MRWIFKTLPRRIAFYAAFISAWLFLSVRMLPEPYRGKWDGLQAAHRGGWGWSDSSQEQLVLFSLALLVFMAAIPAAMALADMPQVPCVFQRKSQNRSRPFLFLAGLAVIISGVPVVALSIWCKFKGGESLEASVFGWLHATTLALLFPICWFGVWLMDKHDGLEPTTDEPSQKPSRLLAIIASIWRAL